MGVEPMGRAAVSTVSNGKKKNCQIHDRCPVKIVGNEVFVWALSAACELAISWETCSPPAPNMPVGRYLQFWRPRDVFPLKALGSTSRGSTDILDSWICTVSVRKGIRVSVEWHSYYCMRMNYCVLFWICIRFDTTLRRLQIVQLGCSLLSM